MKLLKRLGFPEVQAHHKPSALMQKVEQALVKRMSACEKMMKIMTGEEMASSHLAKQKLAVCYNFYMRKRKWKREERDLHSYAAASL